MTIVAELVCKFATCKILNFGIIFAKVVIFPIERGPSDLSVGEDPGH